MRCSCAVTRSNTHAQASVIYVFMYTSSSQLAPLADHGETKNSTDNILMKTLTLGVGDALRGRFMEVDLGWSRFIEVDLLK